MLIILSLVVVAFACLTIFADFRDRRNLVYLFKPLAIGVIILMALQGTGGVSSSYKYFIAVGLGASLAGDIFMMLRQKKFIAGLISFLVAHLFYMAAFSSRIKTALAFWPAVLLLIYALVFLNFLFPHLGRKKIPVVIYVLVITAMAWLAAERYIQAREIKALSALIGAGLFLISDSSLAAEYFIKKRKWGQALTLGAYFAAQLLIALSI
jgi:uncharacterized membrane protein YhhN